MVGFFERLFRRNDSDTKKSGEVAKDRLQFVLVQDRINLPNERMQMMQAEILEVISKYVQVDTDNVDFELSNRDRSGLLIAEIPFLPPDDPTSDPTPMPVVEKTKDGAEDGDDATEETETTDASDSVADVEASSSDDEPDMALPLIEDDDEIDWDEPAEDTQAARAAVIAEVEAKADASEAEDSDDDDEAEEEETSASS